MKDPPYKWQTQANAWGSGYDEGYAEGADWGARWLGAIIGMAEAIRARQEEKEPFDHAY